MEDDDRQLARINQTTYLSLRSLNDLGINQLELVVEEAIVNEAMRGKLTLASTRLPENVAFLLNDAAPIESVEGCQSFRFFWKHYVAYLVTEECIAGGGGHDDESFSGKLVRLYSKSHFLDHLARDTGGHMRPLIHYKIICQNQVIDVAAEDSPEIEILGDASPTWAQ